MSEEAKLAYQFALELAKQLITLSTGILTITVALSKDVFKSPGSRIAIVGSWLCFLISIWFGINHIQALTGNLESVALERTARGTPPNPDSGLARRYLLSEADSSSNEEPPQTAHDALKDSVSDAGILIGVSAKQDAQWQILTFIGGTVFAILYGFSIARARVATPSEPNPSRPLRLIPVEIDSVLREDAPVDTSRPGGPPASEA
jgi:hypothetical protein